MNPPQCRSYVSQEGGFAIGNVDRESTLLRQVHAALRRIHDGSFGACLDCESAIGIKRLSAVPWALRCIRCQEAADLEERSDAGETLVNAA